LQNYKYATSKAKNYNILNKQIDIVNLINQSKKRERKEKLNGIMIGAGSIIALAITGIILI
tara:strand:+ start:286 stop:468 length:183 start_codon:yes stop_codon:yes gene_type:complete